MTFGKAAIVKKILLIFVPSWEFDIINPFAYERCDILHCTTNARFWNPMKVSALREKKILSLDNEELLRGGSRGGGAPGARPP
jgi:hypothetical protein